MATNALILKLSHNGELRRVRLSDKATPYSLLEVKSTIQSIFKESLEKKSFTLSYVDDDGDNIRVTSDIEFQEATRFMQKQADGTPVVRLQVTEADCDSSFDLIEMGEIASEVMPPAVEEAAEPAPVVAEPVADSNKEKAQAEPEAVSEEVPEADAKETDNLVPLSEIVDPEVAEHPFFVSLWTNFRNFTRDIGGSIPPNFSEKVRNELTEGIATMEDSVHTFVDDLEARRKVMVPANWRDSAFFVRIQKMVDNGQESVRERLARWEAARKHLAEIGFTEWKLHQELLIVQHDGNINQIVDDLLNQQDNLAKVESSFQRAVRSMLDLFRNMGVQSRMLLQKGVEDFNNLGKNISTTLNHGAEVMQGHLENRQESLKNLQAQIDANVDRLQRGLDKMHEAGEATGIVVQQKFQEGVKGGQEALHVTMDETLKLYRTMEQNCHRSGNQLKSETVLALTAVIRRLQSLLYRANSSVAQGLNAPAESSSSSSHNILCSECQNDIQGPRYKCVVCVDYNICAPCEVKFEAIHDPTHMLLKIRDATNLEVDREVLSSSIDSLRNSIVEEEAVEGKNEVEDTVNEFENIESPVREEEEPAAPAPVVMEEPKDERLVRGLEALQGMGFSDEAQNSALLTYYNYDVETVLEILLRGHN